MGRGSVAERYVQLWTLETDTLGNGDTHQASTGYRKRCVCCGLYFVPLVSDPLPLIRYFCFICP